ncbi:GNAT family N-acetyltransferase [Streptomyces daliensis]|uniref:GNAT family N-acetyltransferase n=1 Tax=Streptomyces daliensis TaxID=299421 RepID=A0A8T4ISP2_9ACTN|nr:GNAT family N-acetyltransferase [Streptomyces daliensis]
MEPITLSTERLLLRPLDERDVEAVRAACQDPEIPRWIPVPVPYEREHAEEFVLGVSPDGWQSDTMYNFGVFTRDGAFVGSMGLVRLGLLRTPDRQAELGFWTAREQRGKGYTMEAARAVIDWAFAGLGVERLEWVAQVGNEGSLAVALRLGFVLEGVQRARIAHRGTRRDARVAALLPTDWGRPLRTPYLPAARAGSATG